MNARRIPPPSDLSFELDAPDSDFDPAPASTRAPIERPSGVRMAVPRWHDAPGASAASAAPAAPDASDSLDDSERPTLPPPPSFRDVRDTTAPLQELLYRFEVGDLRGVLATAESLLDRRLVPTLVVAWDAVPHLGLSSDAVRLLAAMDGQTSLDDLRTTCGLPLLDALRALCDLLDRRVVTLR